MADKYIVEIKERTWYEWLAWAVWLFVVAFLLQNARASAGELEPLATTIFWVSFFIVLVGGILVWYLRRKS